MKKRYIDWLKEKRETILIAIDDVYCIHESSYDKYRNNFRNQLKTIHKCPKENARNDRLTAILHQQGYLYPIALYKFQEGYMCVDGHHRIKAYLTAGHNEIPGIIYKDKTEALMAKGIPYKGMHNTGEA